MDKKVTEYIERFPEEQQRVAKKLRKIILSLKVREEFRWGIPIYEGKYSLYCGKKENVNLGVSVKGLKSKRIRSSRREGVHEALEVFWCG